MRFGLLGPLTVHDEHGTDRTPGSLKARTLLAVLLLTPNRVVSHDRLETVLWGARPPATARASLHNHLSRLRRALGEEARVQAPRHGILLHVGEGELDVDVFTRRVEAARVSRLESDWDNVAREAEAALGLWRGTPLSDLPAAAETAYAHVDEWQEARLQALEWRNHAELQRGRHDGLLPELRRLAAEFPFRESFHTQLMLALHRTGQQAGALDVYHRLRRTLVDDLGVEPGPEARAAYQHILDDSGRSTPQPPAGGTPVTPTVPTELPRDIASFTGRDDELHLLTAAVRSRSEGPSGVINIHAVDGMPGVGKTAFAVHAAHRLRKDFPDGQIFLPLHAHTPGTPPVDPADALTTLLLALGEDPQRIPGGLEARAGLWRSDLADRRMLILLDDACSSEQIEPLLPGTGSSLVLITSRRRLTALEDVVPLTLEVLQPERAVQLLVAKAGRADLDAGDLPIAELGRLCGYLPLALQLTAARLRHHPTWTAADMVADLSDPKGQLSGLSTEHTSVAAAFQLSYRDLPADRQKLFRHLGMQPGVDVDAYGAAALQDTGVSDARRMLEEIEEHHLIEETTRGRYRMHDLVREYARTLACEAGTHAVHEALERQLDYYLHAATRAAHFFNRYNSPEPRYVTSLQPEIPDIPDADRATAWMRAEYANLQAAVEYAARHGHRTHAVHLPAAMKEFLRTHGHWSEALALHGTALECALAAGDLLGQATALRNMAVIHRVMGRYEQSEANLVQALDRFDGLPDSHGQAIAFGDLASVLRVTGRYEEADDMYQRALRLFRDVGDPRGMAHVLVDIGHVQQLTGRYAEAAESLERALELHGASGNRLGRANALTALGDLHKSAGRYTGAIDAHREALVSYRVLDNRYGEGNALADLGDVLRLRGEYEEAAECIEQALGMFRALGARLGQANALMYLGRVRFSTGRLEAAESDLDEALTICHELGSRMGQAHVLMHLAETQSASGAHGIAMKNARASVDLCRELKDRGGEAEALNILGAVCLAADGVAFASEARECHERALELARAIESPYDEMLALEGLDRSLRGQGTAGNGSDWLSLSLVIARRLDVPDVDRIQARLGSRSGKASTPCSAGTA
ncbi:BTAD domain-containing putative transcriptional regulator [Streptomyces sp. NPDC088252]|uniref:AfsR/SARP family transcriptional regulator n=1 Tax=Streptomyces sp. NPDC088252 TaxID=3365845 RepID=UPI0038104B3D